LLLLVALEERLVVSEPPPAGILALLEEDTRIVPRWHIYLEGMVVLELGIKLAVVPRRRCSSNKEFKIMVAHTTVEYLIMHKVGNTQTLCIMKWDFRGEITFGDDPGPMHYEIYALLAYVL